MPHTEITWRMVFLKHNDLSNLLILIGYFIKDNILQDGGKSILFGIFDGHGGRTVVDFLIENFCSVDKKILPKKKND